MWAHILGIERQFLILEIKNITRTEIILRDTDSLKKIIENKIKCKYMYEAFDEYHGILLEMVV